MCCWHKIIRLPAPLGAGRAAAAFSPQSGGRGGGNYCSQFSTCAPATCWEAPRSPSGSGGRAEGAHRVRGPGARERSCESVQAEGLAARGWGRSGWGQTADGVPGGPASRQLWSASKDGFSLRRLKGTTEITRLLLRPQGRFMLREARQPDGGAAAAPGAPLRPHPGTGWSSVNFPNPNDWF